MPSTVYFMDLRASLKETNFQKFQKLLKAIDVKNIVKRKKKRPLIAVKLHFGEKGNTSYIRPNFVRLVVDALWEGGARPFLTDSNTLYIGTRLDAVSHLTTAIENGFAYSVTRAPVIIADGLSGKAEVDVEINQEQFQVVHLAQALHEAEGMVVMSHFKLHEMGGFGGALKNMAMGGASRKGKMAQHSNISPMITEKKCTGCGECVAVCAVEAIHINPETDKAVIDPSKCVGCAECIAVCPYGNIQIQWNEAIPVFLKKMMEYAYAVTLNKKDRAIFISFITQVSPACDCYGFNDFPIVGDIGVLASTDPVAIDQASADLVNQAAGLPGSQLKDLSPGSDKFKDIYPQIDWPIQLEYAEKLGLGSRQYELVKV